MKEWKVETPNNASALKRTLDKVTSEGWAVEAILTAPRSRFGIGIATYSRGYTVVASREAEA